MNWIQKNYKVGQTIQAPHPRIAEEGTRQAKIINHTTDNVAHPMAKGPTGIMIQFGDGTYYEIDRAYLDENGGGT